MDDVSPGMSSTDLSEDAHDAVCISASAPPRSSSARRIIHLWHGASHHSAAFTASPHNTISSRRSTPAWSGCLDAFKNPFSAVSENPTAPAQGVDEKLLLTNAAWPPDLQQYSSTDGVAGCPDGVFPSIIPAVDALPCLRYSLMAASPQPHKRTGRARRSLQEGAAPCPVCHRWPSIEGPSFRALEASAQSGQFAVGCVHMKGTPSYMSKSKAR